MSAIVIGTEPLNKAGTLSRMPTELVKVGLESSDLLQQALTDLHVPEE